MHEAIAWIDSWRAFIISIGSAIVAIVALLASFKSIIAVINCLRDQKFKEAAKPLISVIAIVIVAAAGITGIIAIANKLIPDSITTNKFKVAPVTVTVDPSVNASALSPVAANGGIVDAPSDFMSNA